MDVTNEKIIKDIRHYQERLERYVANKNDTKVLYAIQKLSKLPINTVHLEETGVGRSVNALKKYGGDVSKAAKDLVAFWKEMVLQEDKSQEESQVEPEEEVDSVYSSDNEMGNHTEEESTIPAKNYEEGPDDDLIENVNCDSNDEENDERNEEYNNSKYKSDDSEIHEQSRMKVSRNDEKKKSNSSRSHSFSADSDGVNRTSNSIKHHSKKRSHTRESSQYEKEGKHKSKKAKHDEQGHSSHEHKLSSSKEESDSKHKSKSENADGSKRKKLESKEKDHKSEDKKSSSHLDKQESDKSKSHSSDKHSRSDKVRDDSIKSTESSSSRHDQDRDKKDKHSSKSSKENDTAKSSSNHKSKKKDKHSKEKKYKDVKDSKKDKIVHGIGSDSGASFAEALGMCGPTVSGKKKSSSSSLPKHKTLDKIVDSPPTNNSSTSQSRVNYEQDELVPELLKEPQLEPLNINISSLLPEITPNYKPLGFPLDCQQKRLISDDEALSRVMSNKNQRTKVYSGNKSILKVESLFQICIRILQDNIDALEYTGGVPYLILKPILEKATPDQLFNMEHHNPYLIEETDELWKLHCQREFKTKKRQEMESWRDMYMRCLDEREARLSFITANIKQSQDKSMPVRTTKLAYVDSFVKPPRNIARQQAKHGTSVAKPSSASKLVSLAKSGEAGKVSVPNPGSRAADRGSSSGISAPVKPKKAPLMAKTLSFLKNRFKR